jgi:hypothetical protein
MVSEVYYCLLYCCCIAQFFGDTFNGFDGEQNQVEKETPAQIGICFFVPDSYHCNYLYFTQGYSAPFARSGFGIGPYYPR